MKEISALMRAGKCPGRGVGASSFLEGAMSFVGKVRLSCLAREREGLSSSAGKGMSPFSSSIYGVLGEMRLEHGFHQHAWQFEAAPEPKISLSVHGGWRGKGRLRSWYRLRPWLVGQTVTHGNIYDHHNQKHRKSFEESQS